MSRIQVAGIVAGVLIWWGSKKTKRVKEVTDRLMMVLSVEPSATSTTTTDAPAVAPPEQTPSPIHSESVAAADNVRVPPARASSQPDLKPLRKDYADATVASAQNTPTIATVTPAMATQESLPTPSVVIDDEMVVPPAEHLSKSL